MLLPSRKASIGWTYNSGEDIATIVASSEVDFSLTDKMLSHVHHPFLPVLGDPCRRAHTRESQVGFQMFCRRSDSESESFRSIEKSSISLNCEQVELPWEKKQLCQDSLRRNIIRDSFLRNKPIISCPKHDPS